MNQISFEGNLTRDPELRHSSEGNPRAVFSVAINEGRGDNERTHFVNVTAFGSLGENVAASLSKGDRVVCIGRLDTYQKEVTVDGGTKQLTMTAFIANAVGPDLRWATAQVTRNARSAGNGSAADGKAQAASPAEDDF